MVDYYRRDSIRDDRIDWSDLGIAIEKPDFWQSPWYIGRTEFPEVLDVRDGEILRLRGRDYYDSNGNLIWSRLEEAEVEGRYHKVYNYDD